MGTLAKLCELVIDTPCFGYKLNRDQERPQLSVVNEKRTRLLAHTYVRSARGNSSNPDQAMRQDREVAIEPLIGRETNDKTGFGGEISKRAEICWVPGGKVEKGEQFQILKRGIWEELPGTGPTTHLFDARATS